MPDVTDQLSIKLTIAEWNQILQVLGDGKYTVVAPLMHKITLQASEQVNPAPSIGAMSNGPSDADSLPMSSSASETRPHKRV